jgi:hypothetical protein
MANSVLDCSNTWHVTYGCKLIDGQMHLPVADLLYEMIVPAKLPEDIGTIIGTNDGALQRQFILTNEGWRDFYALSEVVDTGLLMSLEWKVLWTPPTS